jgi:hypothetical protein
MLGARRDGRRLKFKTALTSNAATWLKVIGRLKPDVSSAEATAEMPLVSNRVEQLAPDSNRTLLCRVASSRLSLFLLKTQKSIPPSASHF